MKNDDARIMASESLQGNLQDVDVNSFKEMFILVILSIQVDDRIETLLGTLVSHLQHDKDDELEFRLLMDDAFSLMEVWSRISLKKYELHLGENIIEYSGPLKITSLGVKNVEPERRTCVLALKLRK